MRRLCLLKHLVCDAIICERELKSLLLTREENTMSLGNLASKHYISKFIMVRGKFGCDWERVLQGI